MKDFVHNLKTCEDFKHKFMSFLLSPIRNKCVPGYDNLPSVDGVGHFPSNTRCLHVLFDVLFTGDDKKDICKFASDYWGYLRVTRPFVDPRTGESLDVRTLCSSLVEIEETETLVREKKSRGREDTSTPTTREKRLKGAPNTKKRCVEYDEISPNTKRYKSSKSNSDEECDF
jgi:hypothetical protein